MDIIYLATWSAILRAAATESNSAIVSFTDASQALYHVHLQREKGNSIEAITNDGKLYWLVSEAIAAKLRQSNFYSV